MTKTQEGLVLLAIFGSAFAFALYKASREIKLQTKDVYKHPNVVIKKDPTDLLLRDLQDNKKRVYKHELLAKTYVDIKEKDTVYFYALDNYDKDSVFGRCMQVAFKTKQK